MGFLIGEPQTVRLSKRHLFFCTLSWRGETLLHLVLLRLAPDQFCILEVIDLHGGAHLVHRLCGSLTGSKRAFLEDVVDFRNVLLVLVTACADRIKHLVQDAVEQLLTLHVTDTTGCVSRLQLVKVLELRPELRKVFVRRESIKVSEHGIALDMTRVGDIQMGRVGVHCLHLFPRHHPRDRYSCRGSCSSFPCRPYRADGAP